MPHYPQPRFRVSRGIWYVEIHKKQHTLGKELNEEALARYGRLMAELYRGDAPPQAEPVQVIPDDSAASLIEKFLAWCHEHRAPETYEWYRWRLQLFVDGLPHKSLTFSDLKPYHLDELVARHPTWASGMKHGVCRAVQRAFRWAKKKGYIDRSPFEDYEKPRPGKRSVVLSPTEFDLLLTKAGCQEFQDLLVVTWETGCRPQESLAVEARHVDLRNARWFFPPDESKGEKWPRIVYLTDRALEITRRLMMKNPVGPSFRNHDGNPWTPFAVNCAFRRAQVRMGMGNMPKPIPDPDLSQKELGQFLEKEARKHAPKYCLYHLRHSWLDRALKSGVDPLTCAILMGHRDPSTISKVYQHLAQSPEFMRSQAEKAAG